MNSATKLDPLRLQIGASVSPVLNDDDYRLILKAKIIKNQWKGTKQELYDFWAQYFPQYPIIIQDNQNMTQTVMIYGMTPGIQQELVVNGYIVPKPAGVRINFIFPTDPVFAYEFDTPYLKGYSQGHWAQFIGE